MNTATGLKTLAFVFLTPLVGITQAFGADTITRDPSACTHALKNEFWREAKLETIEGTIQDVRVPKLCHGRGDVMQLQIKTGTDTFWVNLGPSHYLNPHRFRFALYDQVRVTGFVNRNYDEKFLTASSIERDGKTLALRNNRGTPVWSAKGARSHQVKPAH